MQKILSLPDLLKVLTTKREKILVLVTGCFDLLHQAHRSFLKAAKKKGDLLIVGLEQDQRVTDLKGFGRPVQEWPTRAKNLAALTFVDFIFPLARNFGKTQAQEALLLQIRPDFLAVSENTPFIEEKERLIKKFGGKLIIVFAFDPSISTTKLVNRHG